MARDWACPSWKRIVAFALCLVTGLPGDWARRQASGALAALMVVVTVAGIVGAVAIGSAEGWLHGFWPVAVMVLGIVVGEVAADQPGDPVVRAEPRRVGA